MKILRDNTVLRGIIMTKEEYLAKLIEARKPANKAKQQQTASAKLYPQGYFKSKRCRKCGTLFVPKAPSEHYCCDACKDYGLIEAYYKRVYNITLDEYLVMAEKQNFKCAICGKDNFAMGANHSGCLVVDHSHITGNIRGLLCHNCNRALGLFKDNLNNLKLAVGYLKCNDYPEREYT